MKAHLMFDDRDFDTGDADPPGSEELAADLDLATLWSGAAQGDEVVQASVRSAMLAPLTDRTRIAYRAAALDDCVAQPETVRALYELACHAIDRQRDNYRSAFFSQSSEALMKRSTKALGLFLEDLRELHRLSESHRTRFSSAAFTGLFATLAAELDVDYLAEIEEHLDHLRFSGGVVASARLGRHNQGVDYVVRLPRGDRRSHRFSRTAPLGRPQFGRTVRGEDMRAVDELAALRNRILSIVAGDVGRAAAQVLDFFTALRAELAFYVGCLNLRDHLAAHDLPVCRPDPAPAGSRRLSARGLHDPCLSLRAATTVQGNDVDIDGKSAVVVTGDNQGGKTTFLRSLGVAQLMMQAGMPVAATEFRAATVEMVCTHFGREEDASMTAGKFAEELGRMRKIALRIRPHSLLLCNDSLASTNEREGSEIAIDIVRAMTTVGISVVYVTLMYELAHGLETRHAETTAFLRAARDGTGGHPFRVRPGAPTPSSRAKDLFDETFGRDRPGTDPEQQPTRA